jgi:hypothetical protein
VRREVILPLIEGAAGRNDGLAAFPKGGELLGEILKLA